MAVMAKAPRRGRVKTRLVPPLSETEAAALSGAFLRDITANIQDAARTAPITGYLAYAPAGTTSQFDGLIAAGTRLVLADGSDAAVPGVAGIGRSLLHATRTLLADGAGGVCLVNADSPTLPTAFLAEAADALARPGDRLVLGPAEDGGYYLIGLKSAYADIFTDISWSTATVAAETLARARARALDVVTLPYWYDVDDAVSLARLQRDLAGATGAAAGSPEPFAAPATIACLARFGSGCSNTHATAPS